LTAVLATEHHVANGHDGATPFEVPLCLLERGYHAFVAGGCP
jgi:hypothetical protein